LPSVGVLLALLGIATRVAEALPPLTANFARLLPALAVLVVLVYAGATAARAAIWGSSYALLAQSIAENPRSFRVRTQLAGAYISDQQRDAALEQLEAADAAALPRQRPTVSLMRMLAHCQNNAPAMSELATQFEQRAHGYMDSSVGQALKVLSQRFEAGECATLDGARVAHTVFDWVRNAPQDPMSQTSWMAHYYATRMLASAGDLRTAALHARIAYANSSNNPGVGVLAYQLMSSLQDYDGCRAMLADIKAHVGTDDLATQQAIAVFEAHLSSLPSTPATTPAHGG
jgi:thioredoxin-like negative regulator of GroEL